MAKAKVTALKPVSNGGAPVIDISQPYAVKISLLGTAPIIFHRWNVEGVDAKARAAKGSKAKKQDDLESFVYRNAKGELCIPAEQLRQAIINAAKYRQDPRSPRKSAMDLFKAGVMPVEPLCSLGIKDWSYVDQRRVNIQRNSITRSRPAVESGWKTDALLQVLLPEYITPDILNEVVQNAGRLVGLAELRPTYGRFQVTGFKLG